MHKLSALHPRWRERLEKVFQGILVFSPNNGAVKGTLSGKSLDSRTVLELESEEGDLVHGTLQLALPDPDDIEIVKLGCWTLLFLKSLFPSWSDAGGWMNEATEWATSTGEAVSVEVDGYIVTCFYDYPANVLDLDVRKKLASSFRS